jgi:hypothetical protein
MNLKYNSLPEIDVSELKHKGMSTHEAVFRGRMLWAEILTRPEREYCKTKKAKFPALIDHLLA